MVEGAREGGGRVARSAATPGAFDAALDGLVARVTQDLIDSVVEAVAELLKQHQAPALLDRQGLARALGVGVDTIDRLRREGAPVLRVGDVPRFELPAVLAWLRSRT